MSGNHETDIHHLETQLEQLIKLCDHLAQENALLRERQSALVTERAKLIEKNATARNQVESIIARLKGMETEA